MTGETADLIFPQSEIRKAMCWSNFKNMDSCDIFDLISQRGFPAAWLLLLLAGCLPPHGGSAIVEKALSNIVFERAEEYHRFPPETITA